MIKKFKNFFSEEKPLEERIFGVILNMGAIIVLASAVFTSMENLSILATLFTVAAALFFFIIMIMYYKFKLVKLSKLLVCYLLNCVIIPVIFYTCGGIDSGMPLYMLAGLITIIPTLEGSARLICFGISLLVNIGTVGMSYNMMEGTKARIKVPTNVLAKLSLESRIIDMVASLTLVSIFVCVTFALILKAYQKERENKEILLDKLDTLSKKDELTGLYNRRELFRHLESVGLFSEKKYYVAMFDIDHFKMINDTYGHIFGDKALREISAKISEMCKYEDNELAARYGGEEFVLLIRAKNDEEAIKRVEELRKSIECIKWSEYPELVVTISGGIINCYGYEQLTSILMDVDKLLYEAKNSGRNRICTLEGMT